MTLESSLPERRMQSKFPVNYNIYMSKQRTGRKFVLGSTLHCDYTNRTVDVSIPKYVKTSLHKLNQPTPMESQDALHLCNRPTYGAATQYSDPEDNSVPLPPEGITMVKKYWAHFYTMP